MRLWSSRSQWKSWSLPSKLTSIGTLVGIISLVVGIISLGLYIVDKSLKKPDHVTINGNVYDAESYVPLSDVEVSVTGTTLKNNTDRKGLFILDISVNKSIQNIVTLEFQKDGYKTTTEKVSLPHQSSIRIHLPSIVAPTPSKSGIKEPKPYKVIVRPKEVIVPPKTETTYDVTLYLWSEMAGADILVDGVAAEIIDGNETMKPTIRVKKKETSHTISIKKDNLNSYTKDILIRENTKELFPRYWEVKRR